MTKEKITSLLAQAGLTVVKVSDGVYWTFKATTPSPLLIEKAVSLVKDAGYQVEGSGMAASLAYIRVVNPIHAEGYIMPKKIDIVEANPEDVPEIISEVTEALEEAIEDIPEKVQEIAEELSK